MNTMELVHFVSTGERPPQPSITSEACHYSDLVRPARGAMVRARQFVLSAQRSDGSWLSHKTSDASLASQLILLLAYREDQQTSQAEEAARTVLEQQSPDGGWPKVPGGPTDLSTSVQAYFALKLTGLAPNDERVARARIAIRQLGGADAADAATRYLLALFGQISYQACPAVRPESLLLRRVLTPMTAPLALIWSHRPVREVGVERGVRELFIERPSRWPATPFNADANVSQGVVIGTRLATVAGSTLSSMFGYCERFGWTPLRQRALERAESVLLNNIGPSQIGRLDFSELVWHALALRAIGFSRDRDESHLCETRLDELARADDETKRVCPRVRHAASADTISALVSLGESGLAADHPCAVEGARWLRRLERSERDRMSAIDLSRALHVMSHIAESGSRDELIPTIQVLRRDERQPRRQHDHGACHTQRLTELAAFHLIRLQSPDGGWGVAGARSSAAGITGAVVEALVRSGCKESFPVPHPSTARESCQVPRVLANAVKFLREAQRADGSWDSATGVRLVHGTSFAVRGLLAAGIARDDDAVAAGINWLLAHQHASGGWGESVSFPAEATRSEFTPGPATASQTAWALLALIAADRANTKAALRGVQFLLETQNEDGSWHEKPFVHRDAQTGRWFRSELDSALDPLMALSRWVLAAAADPASETERVPLRLVGATSDD